MMILLLVFVERINAKLLVNDKLGSTEVVFELIPRTCYLKTIMSSVLFFSFMTMLYFLALFPPPPMSINIKSLMSHSVCLIVSDLPGSLFDLV